jgi:hypothetical protein
MPSPLLAQDEFPGNSAAFALAGSHGYRINFAAYSKEGSSRGRIAVSVVREGESAFYNAPALVSEAYVRADLGPLGKVDLAFHPSGRQKTIPVKCSRDTFTYEPGTYEGVVEFKGEDGYTSARSENVPLVPLLSSFCGGGSGFGEAFDSDEPGADLRGLSFAHGRRLAFQVNKNGPRAPTVFSASLRERHGAISIYRTVSGTAPASAFHFDRHLRRAELSPPPPFSGSALLVRSSSTLFPRWSGNLSIDFPGHEVHAAGLTVHVSIRHAHFTRSSSAEVEIEAAPSD